MSKYEAVYFVGDNQAINRVRIDSSKTRNRGAFSGSLAALFLTFIETLCFAHKNGFYPTALKVCRGIVFTHGVQMGGRVGGEKSLSGLYLRNRKV